MQSQTLPHTKVLAVAFLMEIDDKLMDLVCNLGWEVRHRARACIRMHCHARARAHTLKPKPYRLVLRWQAVLLVMCESWLGQDWINSDRIAFSASQII